MSAPVVDHDEYGRRVSGRYRRLGAGAEAADEVGVYVRFEPGFGLNVHIGIRVNPYDHHARRLSATPVDKELFALSGDGWDRLCELVDEWRTRETT